jgi:NAD(P)-dependent dehydrogenase (short-subunit alcohol dehydrogenase family)
VTNGDKEIGGAVSRIFAREGARVAMVSEGDDGLLSPREWSENVYSVATDDLRSEAGCADAVRLAAERLGGIDVVVNNTTSLAPDALAVGLSEDELLESFRDNVFPLFHLASAALPHLERSPAAGIIHTAWQPCYGAPFRRCEGSTTRKSVRSITRSLARQLEGRAIRVNAVIPWVWPIAAESRASVIVYHDGDDLRMETRGMMGWWECAECYVFLASPSTRHITGQVIQPNCTAFLKG